MFDIQKKLATRSEEILHDEFGISSKVSFDIPRDTSHGDLTSSIALEVSRPIKKKPQEVAEKIISGIQSMDGVSSATIAGAGYVNVTLTSSALLSGLSSVRETCEPKKASKKSAPVIIEYSQPNIAKPLGVHHLLSTIIGQALSNLYRHLGENVLAWNYIGDWGTQFGKLSVAYELWGKEKPVSSYSLDELLSLYVRFHEEAEKDASLEEKAREASKKLEEGDKTLRQFWKDVIAITKTSLAELYQRLHVSFDLNLGESFYEDKMEPVLQEGIKKKVFKEGEQGALIAEFSEETKMPPYVIRRSDGGTLYSTRDIAQMRYRIDTYHPKAMYILTDVAQKLHFEQLIATCLQLGWELPEFENVLVPRMRFAEKSMSTRKGNILKLEEVLDEAVKRAESLIEEKASDIQGKEREELADMVGIGAVAYGIVSQNRKMEMVFDWKKILTFEGNSAPYLQYTHARACSVLRKAEAKKDIALKKVSDDLALEKGERDLALTLLRFERVLLMTQKDRMPHILSQYLYELSQVFNAFYHTCPILDASEPVRTLRLFLTSLTARVLSTGASILTLRVPERM